MGHQGRRVLIETRIFEHSYQNVLVLVLQRENSPSLFKYAHKLPVQNANQTNTLAVSPLFSNSPLSADSQQLLRSIRGKSTRKFPDKPYKVNKIVLIRPILGFVLLIHSLFFSFQILCAPDLEDDFYLNLLDWSSENMIAVGLNTRAYLCNASSDSPGTLVIFLFR